MSGKYTGMQARLRDVNPVAFYIPCTAHSLNLVVVSALSIGTKPHFKREAVRGMTGIGTWE